MNDGKELAAGLSVYNFGDCLVSAAETHPEKIAFIFQEGTSKKSIAYRELHLRALNVSIALRQQVGVGERALLVYPPGLDYIIGFMGCLYAGVIAVPVYPPATSSAASKLRTIVNDCTPSIILTDSVTKRRISQLKYANMASHIPLAGQFVTSLMRVSRGELSTMSDSLAIDIPFMSTDELPFREKKLLGQSIIRGHKDSLAFLQYTSGSTGDPKGVMVSHDNLRHSTSQYGAMFDMEGKRMVYWLPPYHDLGLIGGILTPIYYHCETLLFSPVEFLRDPLKWMLALSEHKANISAAPNFAYGLVVKRYNKARLVGMDLSAVDMLLVGAEPVQSRTMREFIETYEQYGLNESKIIPGYGIAEGTLIISGRKMGEPFIRLELLKSAYSCGNILPSVSSEESVTAIGCGSAFAGHEVIIVNPETFEQVVSTQVGEVWIKSESVAKGYWRKPELSTQTFNAFTTIGQGPYLRTGDFGFIYEGQLFISGRLKDLIIIAGRNYYPQDIEPVIEQASNDVRPGCGIAFSVESNDSESLVLLVELREKSKRYSAEELSDIAQKITNDVFATCGVMPEQVILLPEKTLDKTTSGKVRRQPNKQRYLKNELSSFYLYAQKNTQDEALSLGLQGHNEAKEDEETTDYLLLSVSETEERIQAIWAKVLGRDILDINRSDSFIRLGGQSLLIAQLQQTVLEQFGVELPVSLVFEDRNLVAFSSAVDELVQETLLLGKFSMVMRDGTEPSTSPLSAGQQRFLFLDQSIDKQNTYNEFLCFEIEGSFDVMAFGQALSVVTQRHSGLRTSYHVLEDGSVVQKIHPKMIPVYDVVDLTAEHTHTSVVDKSMEDFATNPFNLSEAPLWRTQIIQCAENRFVCTIVFHHSIFDGASARCFVPELFALYNLATQKVLEHASLPRPFQYFEYSQWEQTWRQSPNFDRQANYWKERFLGFESPQSLPRQSSDIGKESNSKGSIQCFEISADLHQAIQAFCHEKGVTPYTFYLAAFYVLLSRYTQSQDIVVGTATANRHLPGSLTGVGYFVNAIPLRQSIDVDISFDELLMGVWQNNRADFSNAQLPFEEIVKLSPARENLFETFFVYQGDIDNILKEMSKADGGNLDIKRYTNMHALKGSAKFNFTLELIGVENHLEAFIEYRCDYYAADFIKQLFHHFHTLLECFLHQPQLSIKGIQMLSKEEAHLQLVTWNDTARPYPNTTIHQLFEEQVKKTPDAIALVYENQEMTYGELNIRANQVAHYLREQGIGGQPDMLVGLGVERSFEMMVGILAILKAGGAYVPFDPSLPDERLCYMLEDTKLSVFLTQKHLTEKWEELVRPGEGQRPCMILALDDVDLYACVLGENVLPVSRSEHLAYVIYTSGTTGKPKGVMVSHHSVVNTCLSASKLQQITSASRVLQFSSINFDAMVWEWTSTLTRGAILYLLSSRHALLASLDSVLTRHIIEIATLTSSVLRSLSEEQLDGLKTLTVAGESLDQALFERWRYRCRLINAYGPTESAVCSSARVNENDSSLSASCIGRPIENTQLYILDEHQKLVPTGIPGELYIGGAGLARGYLNRPDLTKERFIEHQFSEDSVPTRLYRTGDLVRYLPDGNIEYIGRTDNQIKIRGFRVELEEIEAQLLKQPNISSTVVIAREVQVGNKQLIAYIVSSEAIDIEGLKAQLRSFLPEYMVPTYVMQLEKMPLNVNGKVDRRALPAIDATALPNQHYTAPKTEIENSLAKLWSNALVPT